jgi:hypothetical protein
MYQMEHAITAPMTKIVSIMTDVRSSSLQLGIVQVSSCGLGNCAGMSPLPWYGTVPSQLQSGTPYPEHHRKQIVHQLIRRG